jgi:hypothetical protein
MKIFFYRHIASSDYAQTEFNIVIMVDLNTKEDYMSFFMQIKNLGMTQTRYHYIMVSLVRRHFAKDKM